MTPEEFAVFSRHLQTPNGPPTGPVAQPMVRTPVFAAPDPTGVQSAVARGLAATPMQAASDASRTGGSRSWRNNNPGNIEFGPYAQKMGAIGTDGRFAKFASYDAGRTAQEHLLFDSPTYRNLTVSQAISKWAPASENNVPAYVKAMGPGVSPTAPMSSYTPEQRAALLDAMQSHEGWTPGRLANGAIDTASSLGHASYDKGASAVNYASALPTRAYNAGVSALGLQPVAAPNTSPTAPAGWRDASGSLTGTPFGATSNTAFNTQGMSGPGAFMTGLAHPVNGGAGIGGAPGLIPTLINGVTGALAQLFGVTPAQASPAQKQVAVQAVHEQSAAPSATPSAGARPQMQPVSPPTQNPVAAPADHIGDATNMMGAPQPQLAFGRSPMPTGANVLGRPLAPGSDITNPTRLGGAIPNAQPQVWEVTSGPPDASKVPVPLPPSQQPPDPKTPDLPKQTEMPTMNPDNLFGLVMSDTAASGMGF